MTTHRERLAFAAGFFEGEGYILTYGHGKRRGAYPVMGAGQKDKEVLQQWADIFGVPYALNFNKSSGINKIGLFQVRISGFERTQAAIAMIYPWLSPRRREQTRQALSTFLLRASKGLRPRGIRRGFSEVEIVHIRTRYANDQLDLLGLAHEYGVSEACISNIINRKSWAHVT